MGTQLALGFVGPDKCLENGSAEVSLSRDSTLLSRDPSNDDHHKPQDKDLRKQNKRKTKSRGSQIRISVEGGDGITGELEISTRRRNSEVDNETKGPDIVMESAFNLPVMNMSESSSPANAFHTETSDTTIWSDGLFSKSKKSSGSRRNSTSVTKGQLNLEFSVHSQMESSGEPGKSGNDRNSRLSRRQSSGSGRIRADRSTSRSSNFSSKGARMRSLSRLSPKSPKRKIVSRDIHDIV